MSVYISILRGINVSGHKMIKMEALRAMYEEMGFKKVKTYIQSGNVLFHYKKEDPQKLADQIVRRISKHFSFDVPVIVLEQAELKKIASNNPFLKDVSKDLAYLHVTFLSAFPEKTDLDKILDMQYGKDELAIEGKAVYLYCPNSYSNSKLTNGFFESKLKLTATTRNWKTVLELLKMSEEGE